MATSLKTTAKKKVLKEQTVRKTVLNPKQTVVKAKDTRPPKIKAPTAQEINDPEWLKWVEYAQSRIRYLENKLSNALDTIEAQKANIDRLNRRVLQG